MKKIFTFVMLAMIGTMSFANDVTSADDDILAADKTEVEAENEAEYFDLTVGMFNYATLYLDYAVEIPDDEDLIAVMYAVECRPERKELVMRTINDGYIPAHTAVVVEANQGTYRFYKTDEDVEPIKGNLLVGSLVDKTVEETLQNENDKIFTLGIGEMGYLGFFVYTGSTLGANKAYLYLSNAAGGDWVVVVDPEQPTAINEVNTDTRYDGTIYDLSGRKVTNPSKGIFIINGKKVYLK